MLNTSLKNEIATGMFLPNHSGDFRKIVFKESDGTSGNGLNMLINYDNTVKTADSVSLIYFNTENRNTNSSQLFNIKMDVDTNKTDTGAGISINNYGMSDNIYLAVTGKSSVPSAPTGIGIDLNGSDYQNEGFGVQVWDKSTTDRGVNNSPCALYLRKHGNTNTSHRLCRLYGDKNLMSFEIENISTATIIQVIDEDNGQKYWEVLGNGDNIFRNNQGVYFNKLTNGNQSYIIQDTGDFLRIRAGDSGLKIVDNDTNLVISTDANLNLTSTASITGATLNATNGATGSFTTADGKTVTVVNGIITSIV
jgi:hypothetical protein